MLLSCTPQEAQVSFSTPTDAGSRKSDVLSGWWKGPWEAEPLWPEFRASILQLGYANYKTEMLVPDSWWSNGDLAAFVKKHGDSAHDMYVHILNALCSQPSSLVDAMVLSDAVAFGLGRTATHDDVGLIEKAIGCKSFTSSVYFLLSALARAQGKSRAQVYASALMDSRFSDGNKSYIALQFEANGRDAIPHDEAVAALPLLESVVQNIPPSYYRTELATSIPLIRDPSQCVLIRESAGTPPNLGISFDRGPKCIYACYQHAGGKLPRNGPCSSKIPLSRFVTGAH
jgi:hypothetical protein